MELNQRLLGSAPFGLRQRQAGQKRHDQVRAYDKREKALQGLTGHKAWLEQRKTTKVHFDTCDIIKDAIVRHDNKEFHGLLKDGTNSRTIISSGGSLLHLCARHDNALAAAVLIGRGLDVNYQDEDLWTALHEACAWDNTDMVQLLLLAGADVWLQDVNGRIPIDYTSGGSDTRYIFIKYLEENGVDLSSMQDSKTHLSSVMLSDVQHLLAAGESINQSNDEGVTLLHIACASGYEEVVSLLLEGGADPQVADNSARTPLHLAAKQGQTSMLSLMLSRCGDLTPLTCDKEKPADFAMADHSEDTLLRSGECREETLKDLSASHLPSNDLCEPLIHIMSTSLRKPNPFAMTISQWDSFLEKTILFRDGPLTQQPNKADGAVDLLSAGTSTLEQVKLEPPAPNDDLASLWELTESSLLYEMQKRFGNNQIYTYIGPTLLLVNPYKELPIYSTLVSHLYLSSSGCICPSLPPHIFASAERAFHAMLQERQSQCFILSGESGAGKTVACQHVVKHLANRSCTRDFRLESRMEHANCILEAFGHAKSKMNDNSSRFIKLLSLRYCEKTLIGANIHTYALEKSRLVPSPQNQLSFNIFYLLAEQMSPEEKRSLNLSNVLAHRYLRLDTPDGMATGSAPSGDNLSALVLALQALGFNSQEVENLFVILSAILQLGDLQFSGRVETGGEAAFVSDVQLLERVSEMLQVSSEDLGSALTTDIQYIKGNVVARELAVEISNHYRDLLAKSLYGRVFNFLVNKINCYLQGQEESNRTNGLEIGILDIFGFEDFQNNGFEQLCINMTNEKIRQYVTEVIFEQEQAACLQEGVAMKTVYAPRNQCAVLDFFFQVPQGLLWTLDKESRPVHPSEQNFYKWLQPQPDVTNGNGALSSTDGNGNPPPKEPDLSFAVAHYAGTVTYDLTGSLERNKESLPQNILFVMKSSENVVIRQVFHCRLTPTGSLAPQRRRRGPRAALLLQQLASPASAEEPKDSLDISQLLKESGETSLLKRLECCGSVTAAIQFRSSLTEICRKLQGCSPHFIHCIKPNSTKQPGLFDCSNVSTQLRSIEVLEMVKMIRHGYPVRLPFASFLARFKDLAAMTTADKRTSSMKENCHQVLQQSKLQGWQMGNSKVFLKHWQLDHLNGRCHQLHKKIITCQKVVRGWLARQQIQQRVHFQQQERNSAQRLSDKSGPMSPEEEPINSGSGECGKFAEGSPTLKSSRFSPLSSPPAAENVVHSIHGLSIKPPFQQTALTTDEGGGGVGEIIGGGSLSSPRKQPPPKPRRDPNTRLSAGYEAVRASLSVSPKETPANAFLKPRPNSDDYTTVKKTPPPKPKRSPNTRLTGTYEILAPSSDTKLLCLAGCGPVATSVRIQHSREEEDVYIEMVANPRSGGESPELGESVYEEMKLMKPEESSPTQSLEAAELRSVHGSGDGLCCRDEARGFPMPFPNLLPHRPPLLIFPPSPVTCSPASDESPLSPLEVKKLPILDTNLNYPGQGEGGSPLMPQSARQRADSSPTMTAFAADRLSPPLTPPAPSHPGELAPPYPPFTPETSALALTRAAFVVHSDPSKGSHKGVRGSAEAPPECGKPPCSPAMRARAEPRRARSCCSSPLLLNAARSLNTPLDELSSILSSGCSLLRKSATGRKMRFNCNINQPGHEVSGSASMSAQQQDKNANNRTVSSPTPFENGNQVSNGSLENEGHMRSRKTTALTLHRYMDSHHSQVIQ